MYSEDQQLKWAARADDIVAEAARQEEVVLPDLLANAIAQAVRLHCLSQPGVFAIVAAYGNSERQAGRLPLKADKPFDFKD